MPRILIVEDEPVMAQRLERVLRQEGYAVEVALDGATGFARAAQPDAFDAIVLDWMLPGRSGVQVVRGLRAAGSGVPVLMLTARDQVEDQVEALDAGADDHLAKPFALAALLARLRALTRRGPAAPGPDAGEPGLRVGDLRLDPTRHAVRVGSEPVELTAREFALLHAFMRRPGQVFTRALLLESVWSAPPELDTNVVELYVSYLRRKLDRPGQPSRIRTVRGVGYALEPEPVVP
jgi:two-component system OmpR family response regulator